MVGSGSSELIVSRRIRDLIEEWQPISHHYVPLVLKDVDGTIFEGELFLFEIGAFLPDAIVRERSEVVVAFHPRTRE